MSALNLPLCESCDGSNARAIAATYRAASHTPGPWVAHHLEVWDAPADNDSAIMVAKVEGDTDNMMDPGALADARLIAAAPEMYEALAGLDAFSKLLNEFADMHDSSILRETIEDPAAAALDKMRAAFAKARGGA